jgi:hypothetical protein
MKPLPQSQAALVIRTDFSDDAAWAAIGAAILFLMIVDDVTVRSPEHPILVVDLWREPGRGFRAVPAAVQSIENNLSIANMDFAEFADAVDEDGIFRGF